MACFRGMGLGPEATAIGFLMPILIVAFAAVLLGEKIRLRRGLALVVGLIGVLVVIQPGSAPLELGHLA